ncbi:hypothetical protein AMTRI_Chr10g227880 [Amborella trichopoda]
MNTRSSSRALTLWNKRNQTPEDSIIIPNASEEVVPLAILRGVKSLSLPLSSREGPINVIASNSGQVIIRLDWRNHRGLVMAYIRLPFLDKGKRLNYHSSNIHTMEIGCDLLKSTYQLFGHASFSELAMFPFFVKKLMKNLTYFLVPGAGLFKGKMEEITQWPERSWKWKTCFYQEESVYRALAKTPFRVSTHARPH